MARTTDAFDIFNDRYYGQEYQSFVSTDKPASCNFPLWSNLPQEIRLQIWTLHFHKHRFLRVLLEEVTDLDPSPDVEARQGAGVPTSNSYCAEGSDGDFDGWGAVFSEQLQDMAETKKKELLRITFLDNPMPSMSSLQLVCRESYKAYTSFYPIHLPAFVRASYKPGVDSKYKTARIVARLHPDLDTLSLETPHAPQIIELNLLPLFLHTLVQCDSSPANIRFGIRNLCVDLAHLSSDHTFDSDEPDGRNNNTTSLPPEISSSVRLAVSHLRNLYLRLVVQHLEPRVMSGPLSGSGARPWYNASMPIIPDPSWSFTSTVEAVNGIDPRLTLPEGAADLHQVWIGNQIRPSLRAWAEQERLWGTRAGADVAGGVRVRALIGLDAQYVTMPNLYHRSLRDALREEHDTWASWLDPTTDAGVLHRELFETTQQRFVARHAGDSTGILTPEDWFLIRRSQTAVGFWLVEPEALEAASTTRRARKQVVDLSEAGKDAIELWVFKPKSQR
ncbi:hypothetical protein N0V93_006367 [Gnomoniopsis smithogilvyi]|uniref:2EXR domain-containing protein n=1 Tax=Gnomoniopsis smithogilvyi TaxID=1191159 RepID=A0A9W8YPH9_9PEZI|nr:hypothetical protein N0V93_006367 [Gnomoniopsis smithogilvyi]